MIIVLTHDKSPVDMINQSANLCTASPLDTICTLDVTTRQILEIVQPLQHLPMMNSTLSNTISRDQGYDAKGLRRNMQDGPYSRG